MVYPTKRLSKRPRSFTGYFSITEILVRDLHFYDGTTTQFSYIIKSKDNLVIKIIETVFLIFLFVRG